MMADCTLVVTPVSFEDELPEHIRERPADGRWVHLSGTDIVGEDVDYWCAFEAPADEEGGDNGFASLGRRVAEAAFGREFRDAEL